MTNTFCPWFFFPLNCWNLSGTASKRFSSTRRWTLKKSHRKIFFQHGEKWFWKKYQKNPKSFHFFNRKIDFSIEKMKTLRGKIWFFFKFNFLHDGKIFFDRIFFKVHLPIKENRSEAVPERFRQFKGTKTRKEKVLDRN